MTREETFAIAAMELDLAWDALEDALQSHDLEEMTAAMKEWWARREEFRALLIGAKP